MCPKSRLGWAGDGRLEGVKSREGEVMSSSVAGVGKAAARLRIPCVG